MEKALIVTLILSPFVLLFYIIKSLVNYIGRLKRKSNSENQSINDWYGVCEKCGKTDGLHRLNGKRYCAMCHARIKTEQQFADKYNGENNER